MKQKMVRCADVLDVRDGTHDSPKYVLEGYPLITSKNIKEGNIEFDNVNYISKDDFEKINLRSKVDNGDILMPMIGTIGNPVVVNTDRAFAIKNVALFKFSENSKFINRYIYYALKSPLIIHQLNSNKRGGTQSFVSLTNIRDLKIPNVDISIQNRITNILDKAQELIDKRKEQIEACDELIKSLFYHMFGDPVKNDKGFKMKKLGEVSEINPKKKEVNHLDMSLEVSFVPMEFIGTKGQFNGSNTRFMGEVYKGFTYFKTDDVIFAKITPCMENGKGAIAKKLKNNIGFGSTEFHILRPKREVSNCIWLYQLTNLELFRKMAEKNMTGSAGQKRVPSNFLQKIEVAVPPLELQNEFAQKVEKIEQQKHLLEQSLTELENNFNSLMQRAFKGELF